MKELDRLSLEELFKLKAMVLAEYHEEQIKSEIAKREVDEVLAAIEKRQDINNNHN